MRLVKWLRYYVERLIHRRQPEAVINIDQYPWNKSFETNVTQIKRELFEILPFLNSIVNFDDVLPNQRALVQRDKWKTFFLIAMNTPLKKHQELCPMTMEALNRVPGVVNAFFSILLPGTEIPPHRGPYAGILRYHLGLIVPKGDLGIRVAGEVLFWKEGRGLLFDDSFEHEAWNRTHDIRVVLFLDIERSLRGSLGVVNKLMIWLFSKTKLARMSKQRAIESQISCMPKAQLEKFPSDFP